MDKKRYLDSGIDPDEVQHDFFDLEEYEKTLRIYLQDDFFDRLPLWIEKEDYGMAVDAAKGLYILAAELKVFKLYTALLDIYEDLIYEDYKDIRAHASALRVLHEDLLRIWR